MSLSFRDNAGQPRPVSLTVSLELSCPPFPELTHLPGWGAEGGSVERQVTNPSYFGGRCQMAITIGRLTPGAITIGWLTPGAITTGWLAPVAITTGIGWLTSCGNYYWLAGSCGNYYWLADFLWQLLLAVPVPVKFTNWLIWSLLVHIHSIVISDIRETVPIWDKQHMYTRSIGSEYKDKLKPVS